MNFLHLSLMAGLAAMAIPVAMHLLSRRTPKLVAFPALRFVKQTVVQQRGSWQLRHFLLLCLRVGMFGAMAMALARPRVHSAMLTTALGLGLLVAAAIFTTLVALVAMVARRGKSVWMTAAFLATMMWLGAGLWGALSVARGPVVPSSDQTAPVAAALIVDNGPTLDYRAENEKRFVAAKKMANWILGKLPLDSRVGILTGAPISALSLDPATAKGQLDLLQPQALHIDLAARLRTAIDLVLANDLERKEIYIVTDLTKPSWSTADAGLGELVKQHAKEILVQIIDVGAENSTNWRLGDPQLESSAIPSGGVASWQVSVARSAASPGEQVTVKLVQEEVGVPLIDDQTLKVPPANTVDQATVDLTKATDQLVSLTSHALTPGAHNFRIELTKADPLQIDNVRYSTIHVAAQQPTLIVADDADAARLLRIALSPGAADPALPLPAAGDDDAMGKPTAASHIRSSQIEQAELDRYGVIMINDPPSLPPSTIAKLEEFVRAGGGLFICLGPALGSLEDAKQSPLRELLPGSPARISRRPLDDDSLFLVPVSATHSLFQVYESVALDVPWNLFPLRRAWEFDAIKASAQVLMTTSDHAQPALLLERRGEGQIMTLVTPLPSQVGKAAWNELMSGSDPWPAFGLLVGAARLLSGQLQNRTNFAAGESVVLDNDPKQFPTNYVLFAPNGERRNLQADKNLLMLGSLDQAGTYRLRGLQGSQVVRGVSVNTPVADTQLDRLAVSDLDALLGQGNFRVARNQNEVESSVGQARYGRELFPLLMACVALLFLGEQAMSNRFYKLKFAPADNTSRSAARPSTSKTARNSA